MVAVDYFDRNDVRNGMLLLLMLLFSSSSPYVVVDVVVVAVVIVVVVSDTQLDNKFTTVNTVNAVIHVSYVRHVYSHTVI